MSRDGQVRTFRQGSMVVNHGPQGRQNVIVERPDRSVIVANRAGHGYVQRPFTYRNQEFVHRTYYVRGAPETYVYRRSVYLGVSLNVYTPVRYYRPAFYGWVYDPWAVPVRYSWGWGPRPWYGYYRGYFTPYAVYPSAAFWLTDYMIAAMLERAYQEQLDAGLPPQPAYYGSDSQVALTPEVKQAISEEVRRQVALETREGQLVSQNNLPDSGSSGIAPMFSDGMAHVFVVSKGLYVPAESGECALTDGDVLQLSRPPEPNFTAADLIVLASKDRDCRKGSLVSVQIDDLQEMQNQMRETIDQGLTDLQSRQGQGGLPPAPPGATAAPVAAPFAAAAPPPDSNIQAELSQQAQSASQAEQDAAVTQSGASPGTISIGQTINDVVRILGTPANIVDLGDKKIYVYSNLKITFNGGRVSNVE